MKIDKYFDTARTAVSIGIALVIAVIIVSFVSSNPFEALGIFLTGPVDSARHIGNVVEMAIPLAFSGLSFAVLFKSNLFNLGAEGLFFASGLLSAMLAVHTILPAGIHPLVIILAGGLLGALLGCIPCALKAKWDANTLVVSLMMNYIIFGICMYLLNNKLRDFDAFAIVSPAFNPSAKLAKLIPGTRIHWGLVLLILCAVGLHLFLNKTKWGYQIRMMGINSKFANYSGMNSVAMMFLAHAVAGFFAGAGGSVEVLGMYSKFQWTALPGYGLDGALIALLAKSNPAAVPFAALFIAYIRVGADMMARTSDVPAEMVSIIQAIIILLISSQLLLQGLKNKMLLKEAKKNG